MVIGRVATTSYMLNASDSGNQKSSYLLHAGVVVIGRVATCYMLNANANVIGIRKSSCMLNAGASDYQKSSYLLHATC